jgi:DNA-binding winged helix-turn-helix (wHTH) protein
MLNFVAQPGGGIETVAANFRRPIRNLRNWYPVGRTSQIWVADQGSTAPLRLLEILLERPGEVVTREELRNRMWPNESFGDFDQAVNVAIAKLRAALGDSADNPRYVETLPRRGYRFIAEVAVINPAANKLELPAEPNSSATVDDSPPDFEGKVSGPKPLSSRHVWTVLVVAMTLLLAMAAVWIFLWKSGQQANSSPSSPIRSIAVLPLENLSSNSEDYFADGMTDELITDWRRSAHYG